MAIFRLLKMAAIRHLRLLYACLDHPQKVFRIVGSQRVDYAINCCNALNEYIRFLLMCITHVENAAMQSDVALIKIAYIGLHSPNVMDVGPIHVVLDGR